MHNTNHAVASVRHHNHQSLTHLPPEVTALNLSRLKHKFTTTSDAVMSAEEWETAEPEYRRFLALKVFHPGITLVPSTQVRKIWQAHILDTRAYREDCEMVFGRYIDHYPYFGVYGAEDERLLQDLITQTLNLYKHHFGTYPKQSTDTAKDACLEVTA